MPLPALFYTKTYLLARSGLLAKIARSSVLALPTNHLGAKIPARLRELTLRANHLALPDDEIPARLRELALRANHLRANHLRANNLAAGVQGGNTPVQRR